ncbi:MAG TPA: DUF4258 domain-containing protein [Bacteroidia bacterium]|nr:DUF4258 domain-containing protein [Bacteroidia bacterium]
MLLLLAIVFGIKKCKESKQTYPERPVTTAEGDWRSHKLVYTKHARCRMDCREISEAEVEFILSSGTINTEKSKEADDEATGKCPTYALEGNTKDGQHVRIVYGACDKITKVITAIDLGEDHTCNCR